MKVEPRADGYWITNTPPGVLDMGPYETRREAREDLRGVRQTLRELETEEPFHELADDETHLIP